MKVAIIGSRNCKNLEAADIARRLPEDCSQVISGGATGVDTIAAQVASMRALDFVCIRPDYGKYGRQAPILRNLEIVRQADLVLAFWDFHSRGTAHTISECIKKQVPVRVYNLDGL